MVMILKRMMKWKIWMRTFDHTVGLLWFYFVIIFIMCLLSLVRVRAVFLRVLMKKGRILHGLDWNLNKQYSKI